MPFNFSRLRAQIPNMQGLPSGGPMLGMLRGQPQGQPFPQQPQTSPFAHLFAQQPQMPDQSMPPQQPGAFGFGNLLNLSQQGYGLGQTRNYGDLLGQTTLGQMGQMGQINAAPNPAVPQVPLRHYGLLGRGPLAGRF